MNDTKWNEMFQTFYAEERRDGGRTIPWRTTDRNGYVSPWDQTWTHFGSEPTCYRHIQALEIRLTAENREYVLEQLHRIHVPGIPQKDTVTVFGYPQAAEYL